MMYHHKVYWYSDIQYMMAIETTSVFPIRNNKKKNLCHVLDRQMNYVHLNMKTVHIKKNTFLQYW